MNIFLIISGVFFSLIAIGFLVGFFRGWCKSLIRLGITIVNILIAFLLAPLITRGITSIITNGSEISLLGFSFNISDFLTNVVGNDINISESTTSLLVTSIANVFANILLFLTIFLGLQILSLIIYWITILILHLKCKEDKQPQHIGLRCLGGIQGVVGVIALLFVMLVPFFGVINVMDKTLDNSQNQNTLPQANAVSIRNSFICGELFYEDNENIEQIDSLIDSYAKIRKQYNSTFMGIILKYTGIHKLGIFSFNHLTNISIAEQDISLTDEIISIIETYNSSKTLLNEQFDYTSNSYINKIRDVYENATNSIFIQRYLADLVPTWAEKWSNNEEFFNIKNPIPQEYQETTNYLLQAIASARNFSRLDYNVNMLFDTVIVLNNHGTIESIVGGQNVLDVLSADKTVIEDFLNSLSSTGEFKNALPNTLNSALSIVYDIIVKNDNFIPYISDTQLEVDWQIESNIIQNLINEFLSCYSSFSSEEELSSESLSNLGSAIDIARTSQTLSTSLKSFMICLIQSDMIDFDVEIKNKIVELINTKWDITENPDYSFENSFSSILETENIVNAILNNINATSSEQIQDVDMSELSIIIKDIVSDEASKNLILEIIKDEDIMGSYIGTDTVSNAMVNTLSLFIENTTPETIDTDLNALDSIVNIISSNSNITELNQNACNELINSIGNSTTIMNIIDSATNSSEITPLETLISNIGQSNLESLSQSIETSELTNENKVILNKLFNI